MNYPPPALFYGVPYRSGRKVYVMFGNFGLFVAFKSGAGWFIFRNTEFGPAPVDGGYDWAHEAHRAMVDLEISQRLFDVCNP